MERSFPSSKPPMGNPDRRDSEDSYENDSYFYQTYVPLSNLPTPPLSSHSVSSIKGSQPKLDFEGGLNTALSGQ
jgi:hypothetical protein